MLGQDPHIMNSDLQKSKRFPKVERDGEREQAGGDKKWTGRPKKRRE